MEHAFDEGFALFCPLAFQWMFNGIHDLISGGRLLQGLPFLPGSQIQNAGDIRFLRCIFIRYPCQSRSIFHMIIIPDFGLKIDNFSRIQ